jgi:hypothetical protein
MFAKGISSGSLLAAYCTDKYLVILSNGYPNHPHTLAYVPHPPGGSSTGGYASQCVTRQNALQYFRFKIPLYPTLLSTASGTNNANYFPTGVAISSSISLPNEGNIGVTVTGLPMYPALNNVGSLTWIVCEVVIINITLLFILSILFAYLRTAAMLILVKVLTIITTAIHSMLPLVYACTPTVIILAETQDTLQ